MVYYESTMHEAESLNKEWYKILQFNLNQVVVVMINIMKHIILKVIPNFYLEFVFE